MYKRRGGNPDANQQEIVDTARKAGVSVCITSTVGWGFPDLVVGHHGQTYLVEIKTGKEKLRPNQLQFRDEWRGGVIVEVRTAEELLKKLGVLA